MSKIRKHIKLQLEQEYPEPKENESIVRVVETRGTNQVQVEYPNGNTILCMTPTKFRKMVWIKKGQYLIISTSLDSKNTGKIKGMIVHILQDHQIRHLKKEGLWPKEFEIKEKELKEDEKKDEIPSENPNRINFSDSDDDESVESTEE